MNEFDIETFWCFHFDILSVFHISIFIIQTIPSSPLQLGKDFSTYIIKTILTQLHWLKKLKCEKGKKSKKKV